MDDASRHSLPELENNVDPQVSTILKCLAPEEIDMLRDAFIYMDKDSDGFVNLKEMLATVQDSVPAERYGPLQEYLTPLFLVADKDGDNKLSLSEFLMSFADGPGVVPADVVNNCVADVRVRLTDEEISTLQENFHAMDVNADGFLDVVELEAALRKHLEPKFPDLTDDQYKEIVTVIMSSADADLDGKLCLSEFIRSFQEDQGVLPASFVDPSFSGLADAAVRGSSPAARELTEAEVKVLREAFAVLDKNDDGYLDFVDLYNALWESLSGQVDDVSQIKDLCDLIMATADRRNSGRLSLSEFILGFLRNMEVMQIPVAVAQEKVRSACERLQQMFESGELERLVTVFEDLDSNGDGYLDRAEMVNVLTSVFTDAFPEWDEETLNSVMLAVVTGAETHSSGRISLEDFIRSFVDGPGILPPEAVRVLDSRASNSRGRARPDTASDDDLRRISDALRSLNETADSDGYITEENLRCGIEEAFADQQETHPGKAEAMFFYVLSRFMNTVGGGRLEWNDNVQIEEVEDGEGDASARQGGAEPGDAEDAGCCPIHVPSAQEQEPLPGDVAVADDAAADPVEFTNRDVNTKGATEASKRTEGAAEESVDDAAEKHLSAAMGHRRRIVRADSVDVVPVTTSTALYMEVLRQEGLEANTTDTQPAKAVAAAANASDAAAVDADGGHFSLALSVDDKTDPRATVPAVVEKAAPSASIANPKERAVACVSSSSKGALSTQKRLRNSYQYGAGAGGDHDTGSIFEEELRMLFKHYDTEKLGCLDRDQFKKAYCGMEQYGLEPSQLEIDRQFSKYSRGSNKIFFDEFCVLMLQRVQM